MSVMANAQPRVVVEVMDVAEAIRDGMRDSCGPKHSPDLDEAMPKWSSVAFPDSILELMRKSPFVGSRLHAPPSPVINFAKSAPTFSSPMPSIQLLSIFELEACDAEGVASGTKPLPGKIPEELWACIVAYVAEVPAIPIFASVADGFGKLLWNPLAWQGATLRVPVSGLRGLAPVLGDWLAAWSSAKRLVIPRSTQLLAEIGRRAPRMSVETAWHFDHWSAGDGVEIVAKGKAVRRRDPESVENVVALGDAPLVFDNDRPAYFEVRLDQLDDVPQGDGMNDFGIGLTACDPEDVEDAAVADEVPSSWIVDFSQSAVCLNVNNNLETKGEGTSASSLVEGDRVGIRLTPKGDALEVFINGVRKETLRLPPDQCVHAGAKLHPVFDLYGRVVQMSRTDAEGPEP